jgi:hypothetical protein
LNFGANGYQIHGESLSPQEDLSQVQPISGNILPISLPLDQAQHNQSLDSIAKLEPSQIALENKIHEKTFGGKNTEELLEEIFEEALSETKPRGEQKLKNKQRFCLITGYIIICPYVILCNSLKYNLCDFFEL